MFLVCGLKSGNMKNRVSLSEDQEYFFYCFPANMIGFAKDIVQLLSTRF